MANKTINNLRKENGLFFINRRHLSAGCPRLSFLIRILENVIWMVWWHYVNNRGREGPFSSVRSIELRRIFFKLYFFASGGGYHPLYPESLQYYTIPQRPLIIVGDAGFEPGTSAPEVWPAANEPPHLLRRIL